MTQPHLEPPPIPLIKENQNVKLDKYFVKQKLCRYPTSSTSDLYEFKISFFDNGEPEEFLLLFCNFNMTLAVSGTLESDAKFQYLSTIVCREALLQFESFSDDVESTETLNVDYIIRCVAQYPPPVRTPNIHLGQSNMPHKLLKSDFAVFHSTVHCTLLF